MSDIMSPSSKSAKSGKGYSKKLSELMIGKMNLEVENNGMVERLEQLRLNMQKEREERQNASGFLWKSGQAGSLTYPSPGPLQNKESSVKVSPGKTKLKVLKDTVPGPVKQSVVPKPSFSVIENTRSHRKTCGQCEDKNAMLTCYECGEDYCVTCFTRFHQRGALKLHRTTPMQIIPNQIASVEAFPSSPGSLSLTSRVDNPVKQLPDSKTELAEQVKKEIERDLAKLDLNLDSKKEIISHSLPNNSSPPAPAITFSSESVSTSSTLPVENPSRGALLQGTFNEKESSESFNEILIDWRNEKPDFKTKLKLHEMDPESVADSEVQTLLTTRKKALDIDFTQHGLNYMERLMLKKHRRTPVAQLPNVQIGDIRHTGTFLDSSNHRLDEEDQGLTVEEMEDHEQFAALFRTLPTEESPERAVSSLKFVELNEVPEEDLEECSNFLVQEVLSELHFTEQSIPTDKCEKSLLGFREKADLSQVCNGGKQTGGTRRDSRSKHDDGKKKATRRSPRETPKGGPEAVFDCGDRISTRKGSGNLGNPRSTRAAALPTSAPRAVNAAVTSSRRSQSANKQTVEASRARTSQNLAGSAAGDSSKQVEDIRIQDRTPVSTYRGLDGFFVLGVDPKEVQDLCTPRRSESTRVHSGSLCAGGGQWRPASSLGYCADNVLVQTVVEDTLKRQTSHFGQLTLHAEVSQVTLTPQSLRGYKSQRSLSATILRLTGPKANRPASAASRPLSRAATEILEIESIDSTEHDDSLAEDDNEQQALARLEKEFIDLKADLNPQSYLHNVSEEELHLSVKARKSDRHLSDSKRTATKADLAKAVPKKATGLEQSHPSSVNLENENEMDDDDDDDDEEQSRRDKENVMSLN